MLLIVGCTNFNQCVKYNAHEAQPQTVEQLALIREALAGNLLRVGMTEQEVIDLIGKPQSKDVFLFGSKILWKYTSHGRAYDVFVGWSRPLAVIFENGIVVQFGIVQFI